jgi:hypothetical protein
MELKLVRTDFTEDSTIGELYVDGQFECYILEDTVRDSKIYGKTAIPYGTYDIKITFSPRFKRHLPILVDVPNYQGVRIHVGNYSKDTEGCLLPGRTKGKDFVGSSRAAFNKLYGKMVYADQHGEKLTIEITK